MGYLNEDEEEILTMGNDKDQNSISYLIYFLIFIALSSLSLYVVYKIFGANSNFSVFKSYSLSIFSSLLLLLYRSIRFNKSKNKIYNILIYSNDKIKKLI